MQLFDPDGESIALLRLDVVLTAGGAVNFVARPSPYRSPKIGTYRLTFGLPDPIIDNLEVTSLLEQASLALHNQQDKDQQAHLDADWLLQVATAEEEATPSRIVKVWQRGPKEGFGSYLKRWLSPNQLEPVTSQIGAPEDMSSVFPPESVLMAPPGSSALGRLCVVDALCFEHSASFAGFFQLPGGSWSAYADCPYATDMNHVAVLSPPAWHICGAPVFNRTLLQARTQWVEYRLHLGPETQADWIGAMIGRAVHTFDGNPNHQIPFRPMTIRWSEQGPYRFCHTLRFRFDFNDQGPVDTIVTLGLSLRRVNAAGLSVITPPMLLAARFDGWEVSNPYLIKLLPPDDSAPLPKAFSNWQPADGNNSPYLLGALTVPGFVRDSHSAFWSQLEAGRDHVVVLLRAGGQPLVLGSAQRMREGLSELSLAASQLWFGGVTDSGTAESEVLVNCDGTVTLTSTQNLTVQDNLEVTANSVLINSKTTIKTSLDIG